MTTLDHSTSAIHSVTRPALVTRAVMRSRLSTAHGKIDASSTNSAT